MSSKKRAFSFTRPWLYEKQLAAIYDLKRYSVIEAAIKTGKTFGCIVWLTEQAINNGGENKNFWWVSPVFSQAEIAFRRLRAFLPEKYRLNCKVDAHNFSITLPNGSCIWFKGSDRPDSLYGEDVYAAIMDESSRCREDSFHALRSTLTFTRGPIRIIGNVKGRKNWAYRLARRAESGDKDMAFHRITASDAVAAGVLSQEEIDDAERVLPPHVFQQLFNAVASEDEGNPFGSLEYCIQELTYGPPVVWGWDLAKSVNWTVGIGLDLAGRVCRFERFQMPWLETIDAIIKTVGTAYALVDSTGVGDPILETLQRISPSPDNYEGYKFTSSSKQQLVEGLAVGIQRGDIGFPRGVITNELDQFEYMYTRTGVKYGAPTGCDDDAVCALALAFHAYRHKYLIVTPGPIREVGNFFGFSKTVMDIYGKFYNAC